MEKLVYILLDTQNTAFIDQEVSCTLHADEVPVSLNNYDVVENQRVSGLRVRGHNSIVLIDLLPVYTKKCIQVNHAHIPTCETASQWAE